MKDGSLPYVYVDEDEGKTKKRKKNADAKDKSLAYEYIDEDEGKTAKSAKKADTRRELPYDYVDEDEGQSKKASEKKRRAQEDSRHKAATSEKRPAKSNVRAKNDLHTKKKKSAPAKRKKSAAPAVLAFVLVIVLAAGALFLLDYKQIVNIGGFSTKLISLVKPQGTAQPVSDPQFDEMDKLFSDIESSQQEDNLNAADGNSVSVKDLAVTPGLDESWLNILLLGADTRNPHEACRTDTMIICSINRSSGEIKLTSLMRDTALRINGGTNRINSAYFFGGANLAMQTVNSNFGMNIQYYAFVDFSGFATIAEKLGGIEMDITKNEMDQINHNVREQYAIQIKLGRADYDAAKAEYLASELTQYGKNVHLNGMQTLGYARIRKLDSDFGRAERQRAVLNKLMLKMKGASSQRIMELVLGNLSNFKTNLNTNTIVELAGLVLGREGFEGAKELRLPETGTYVQERRGNEDMLYDVDLEANTRKLHQFIYGQ